MELFHFDIETAAAYKNFEEFKINDIRGANLFENKFNKMKWQDTYNSISEAYLDQAGIISTYGRICCISFGYLEGKEFKISSYYGGDEKQIVESFNTLIKKVETKNFNLSGYRIAYFDIPWVLHKLHKYSIEPAKILTPYGKKPWDMRITDISDDWKNKFAWCYSFDEVCYELKIDTPKDKMCGKDVNSKFWEGKYDEIKDYCEKDVKSSIEIANIIYN